MPDNAGRGYILRLILRRAIRFLEEKLHAPPLFFATLVDHVVSILGGLPLMSWILWLTSNLGDAFPELKRDPAFVKQVINDEEKSFRKTLARGQRLFAKVCETHAADKVIPGDVAWQLYDTYGFPIDLTKLMAQERGFTVDRVGFDAARLKAQEISRAIVKTVNVSVDLDVHAISELKNKGVPETNDGLVTCMRIFIFKSIFTPLGRSMTTRVTPLVSTRSLRAAARCSRFAIKTPLLTR